MAPAPAWRKSHLLVPQPSSILPPRSTQAPSALVRVNWPLPDPGRIILSGDWHGNGQAARNAFIAAYELEAPLILQLGDFGMWPGPLGQSYLDELAAYIKASGIAVAWIDGNHEDFPQLYQIPVDPVTGLRPVREGLWHLPRGSRWTWHGLEFLALGGATSLDKGQRRAGKSWWPEEEITDQDITLATLPGHADVMLTHDCPTGVDIPGIYHRSYKESRYWPLAELERAWDHRDRLAKVVQEVTPRHIWHGHFHVRYQQEAQLHSSGTTLVQGLASDGEGPLANLALATLTDGQAAVISINADLELEQ